MDMASQALRRYVSDARIVSVSVDLSGCLVRGLLVSNLISGASRLSTWLFL